MPSLLDAVLFVPTAGGTTDWTVSSAVTGYQTPAAAGAGNGKVYYYRAESNDLTQWEEGFGTYSTGSAVLTRTTVVFNSAGTTAKINFTSPPNVAIVCSSPMVLQFDDAMSLTAAQKKMGRENLGTTVGYPHIIIEEQKANTFAGGSSVSGNNTRALNTIVHDPLSILVSLTAGKFTLPPGSYYMSWSCPAYKGDQHAAIMRNDTVGANVGQGTSAFAAAANNVQNTSIGSAVTTIVANNAFLILHNILTAQATNGLGVPVSLGSPEVYSRVEVTRIT